MYVNTFMYIQMPARFNVSLQTLMQQLFVLILSTFEVEGCYRFLMFILSCSFLCFLSAMARVEVLNKILFCVFTEEKFCVCI